METTIVYWGLYGDNGKENGNYYNRVNSGFMFQSEQSREELRFRGYGLRGLGSERSGTGRVSLAGVSRQFRLVAVAVRICFDLVHWHRTSYFQQPHLVISGVARACCAEPETLNPQP